MPATRSLLALCALAATTMAQTTSVTSLFMYGFEGGSFVASVVSAAPQAVEYFITCAPGTDGSDCGLGPGLQWTEGPSTVAYHLTESDELSIDFNCKKQSNTASCTETVGGSEANFPGTFSNDMSDFSDALVPVTITAGLALLSGGGASATSTVDASASAATAPSTGASATPSGAAATKTASGAASGTSATGAAAESSDAGSGAARCVGRGKLDLAVLGLVGLVGMVMVV